MSATIAYNGLVVNNAFSRGPQELRTPQEVKVRSLALQHFAEQVSLQGLVSLNSKFVTVENGKARKATVLEVILHFFQNFSGRNIRGSAAEVFAQFISDNAVDLERLKADVDFLIAQGVDCNKLLEKIQGVRSELLTLSLEHTKGNPDVRLSAYLNAAEKLMNYAATYTQDPSKRKARALLHKLFVAGEGPECGQSMLQEQLNKYVNTTVSVSLREDEYVVVNEDFKKDVLHPRGGLNVNIQGHDPIQLYNSSDRTGDREGGGKVYHAIQGLVNSSVNEARALEYLLSNMGVTDAVTQVLLGDKYLNGDERVVGLLNSGRNVNASFKKNDDGSYHIIMCSYGKVPINVESGDPDPLDPFAGFTDLQAGFKQEYDVRVDSDSGKIFVENFSSELTKAI